MHEGNLFAQSKVEISGEAGFDINHFLDQTADSSRYFALRIQGAGGREAMIGFGFRDRDEATDLRESLQHYKKSIRRESQATDLIGSFTVPKMQEGEQIHVNIPGKSSAPATNNKKKQNEGTTSAGNKPMLLKKPPPPADDIMEKMQFSMGNFKLDCSLGDNDESECSSAAVYSGEDDQDDDPWDATFDTK
jgi:hypothetical protein